MPLLTLDDLIAAGYPPGPQLHALLARAADYERRGVREAAYALKLLKRDFGAAPPRAAMRADPAPLAEAISPASAAERDNLNAVRRQISGLLKCPVIERAAILPDACPVGPGAVAAPVGSALLAHQAILPSAHSSDICCSMFATFYEARSEPARELDALALATRFGPGHRHLDDLVHDPVLDEEVWENRFLSCLRDRARTQLADQGDGNHFASIGEMEVEDSTLALLRLTGHGALAERLAAPFSAPAEGPRRLRVLVTHHGSRSLGAHVFKRGQIAAEKHVARIASHIPPAAAWLDAGSDSGADYLHALAYVARWTRANHRAIHRRFLERIGAGAVADLGNEHNFVWRRGDHFLHGKGATPAWRDDEGRPALGLIPLHMAAPILLVLGADQAEFLSFAPHGAGRNFSRSALRRQHRGQDHAELIRHATRGIDVRWFCGRPDLSETPLAYKDADAVKRQIRDFGLAEVVAEIRPLGCIMAGASRRRDDDEAEEILSPKQIRQIQHRADRRRSRRQLTDADRWDE